PRPRQRKAGRVGALRGGAAAAGWAWPHMPDEMVVPGAQVKRSLAHHTRLCVEAAGQSRYFGTRADPERPGQRNDAMNRRELLALSLFAVPVLLTAPSALLAAPAPAAAPVDPYQPVEVDIRPGFEVGSIVVVSKDFFLYHIIAPGKAIRYGIAVGKNELVWKGRAVIGRKTEWPSWRPTPEMIE